LLDALRANGRLDRTIVVVMADHGEAFREHGRMLHTRTRSRLNAPMVA
jgi:arylsulfatase A-like enzyme